MGNPSLTMLMYNRAFGI